KKRRYIILFAFISVVVATAVYNNLQTPVYMATATVRVQNRTTALAALTEQFYGPYGDILSAEEKIITSTPVIEEAARRLKIIGPQSTREEVENLVAELSAGLSTEKVPEAEIIRIMFTLSDPQKARDIVNTITKVYVEENFKRGNLEAKQRREFIEKQLVQVEERLKTAEDKMAKFKAREVVSGVAVALTQNLAELQSKLSDLLARATEKHPDAIRLKEQIQEVQNKLKQLPASELEFARLNRDVETHEQLYKMLRQRFEEARISEGSQVSMASIVNPAIEPKVPIRPNKKFTLVVGSIIGIITSLVLAFLAESLDTSIGTIEDVENVLKLPVLAVVPSVKSESRQRKGWLDKFIAKHPEKEKEDDLSKVGVIVHLKPMSQMAEAFRILRTNLKISEGKKVLLFTSAGPREGKTTIVLNLAISLSQMGIKTLVIDADLRRPSLNKLLGIEREKGLYEIVVGEERLTAALHGLVDIMMGKLGFDAALKYPGLDNLHIITSGHIASNPSEILSSPEINRVIKEAKERFDVVLLDAPPVLSITDAAILAPKVDGVVLVYEMGRTARSALLRAKIQLESVGAKTLGVV
ncbi:MAG: GumC family protein, partial [Candidatus Omnitrophota bacterium]